MVNGVDLGDVAGYMSEDGKVIVELAALMRSGYSLLMQPWKEGYFRGFHLHLRKEGVAHSIVTSVELAKIEEYGSQYFVESLWKARYAMENPDKMTRGEGG